MMVTFVSQCEKNALKKTRRVLDAFANRIGDNTWQTIITEEGLQAVKKLLRKTASKSTAVSCHWIRSRSRSQFLWVVGNKSKFNFEGVVPVNLTSESKHINEQFALNTNIIALLSNLAGLFHDVGKASELFQDKLRREQNSEGKGFEPYRHEWVSLRVFQAFVNERPDKEWLRSLVNIDNDSEELMLKNLEVLRDGLVTNPNSPFQNVAPVAKLVAWLIVSHHKLPQYPDKADTPPSFDNIEQWLAIVDPCWNSPQCLNSDWDKATIEKNWTFPEGTPFKSAHWQTQVSILAEKILNNERVFIEDWFDQHFTAHLSRLSLMLADHYYSSDKPIIKRNPEWQDRNYKAYANTYKDEFGKKQLKQKLDEHNIAVGDNAFHIAHQLPDLKYQLTSLKPNPNFTKKVPTKFQNDFGWQDTAFNLAKKLRDDSQQYGFFGICKASTGKGKTRANARIMYGLSEEGQCRFNIALGLRTLTLQTGDVLKRDLGLKSDELALLIGSQAVKDLHRSHQVEQNQPTLTEQEQLGSGSSEPLVKDALHLEENLPEFVGEFSKWCKHDPKLLKLIQAPVLVSTIDYLMPANEGIRGGRQIAPMLRLLTSDLVLDEPDDFGLEDMPALCRLVNWAGMLGSRVLLSTATISPSLARALFSAYQAGRKHYTQVNGEKGETKQICCAWFDEFKKPKSVLVTDVGSFVSEHALFVDKRIANLKKEAKPLRKAQVIHIGRELDEDKKPSALIASIIKQSITNLHEHHAVAVNDKQISIGLVRMANIDPMVQVAKQLLERESSENTVIHYCVYHSQFPLIQRSHIEQQLDKALSRGREKDWLLNSGIPEIVSKYTEQNHIFVVLATAVAEVGRDHDYDWAIVEPSSMRSIIQLAGRIQRHRKNEPNSANMHILSKNFKGLKGKAPSFEKPGFETANVPYSSNDINDLTVEHELDEINAIARIKMPEITVSSIKQAESVQITSFNLLEHLAQELRLFGNDEKLNHASQWWGNEVTWSGELQGHQPFRKSEPQDDFSMQLSRTGKFVWYKKVPKTFPPVFEPTNDIAKKSEPIKLAKNISFWGSFNLEKAIDNLHESSDKDQQYLTRTFTHITLRKLAENGSDQWQHHAQLGVYTLLKKDGYQYD